jgi:acetylornithine deacetylase
MTVTQINAGKQHNVVPSECDIVVDIRVNDATLIMRFGYRTRTQCRSYASLYEFKFVINPENHGLVQAGIALEDQLMALPRFLINRF